MASHPKRSVGNRGALIATEVIEHLRAGHPLTAAEVASTIDFDVSHMAVARELRWLGLECFQARRLGEAGYVKLWRFPPPRPDAADRRRALLEGDRAPPFRFQHGTRATRPRRGFGLSPVLALLSFGRNWHSGVITGFAIAVALQWLGIAS